MSTVETQTVRAQAKWVRTSARKARVVAEHIRGRSVPEARAVLAFTQRAAARDLEKVLSSAVANAESRPDLHWNGDDLVVASVTVDEGPTLKRWRARARGRVARIKKRTCHITVKVVQNPNVEPRKRRAPATPAAQTETPPTTAEATTAEETPKKTRTPRPKKDDATTAKPTSVKPSRSRQTKGDR